MDAVINLDIAKKVLNAIDAGLVSGVGVQEPGKMCVEAAVCYALGLPHGDDPKCVAESLRCLKIRLNDTSWSSNDARAKGLRRLGLAQLGSIGVLDEKEFTRRIVGLAVTKQVPAALRAAASRHKDPKRQASLNDAAKRCEDQKDHEACLAARDVCLQFRMDDTYSSDTYAALAARITADNACAAYDAASVDYVTAVERAGRVAICAATAVDHAHYASYDSYASCVRDKALADFAEDVVQILIDMNAPGCQWLHLTESA